MGSATNKNHILDGHVCPRFHAAIELVGRRWTGAVILTLMDKPRRFGEILEAVPDLHDRLLSERLKQLESAGLVERRVYPETPVRIEYAITTARCLKWSGGHTSGSQPTHVARTPSHPGMGELAVVRNGPPVMKSA